MNRAVATPQSHQPGAMEQVSYLTNLERTQSAVPQPVPTAQPRMEVREEEKYSFLRFHRLDGAPRSLNDARFSFQRIAEAVRTASQIPQGFKDLIQKRCEERGILFMPIPNRYREAKQVYKIGNVQAYIDRNVVFVCHNGSTWAPTHLNALLDTAEI